MQGSHWLGRWFQLNNKDWQFNRAFEAVKYDNRNDITMGVLTSRVYIGLIVAGSGGIRICMATALLNANHKPF